MTCEEIGEKGNPTIVFLHCANRIFVFGRQYRLSDRYHILAPHIMGYGEETNRVFQTEEAVAELVDLIRAQNEKVTIIGQSLGAELALKMIAEHEELFARAIIVEPWLCKTEPELSRELKKQQRRRRLLRSRLISSVVSRMVGIPQPRQKNYIEWGRNIQPETVKNMVYNGITLDSLKGLQEVSIPIRILAGEKERDSIKDSALALEKLNPNFKCELWFNAEGNIPPVFYRRFNSLICDFVK